LHWRLWLPSEALFGAIGSRAACVRARDCAFETQLCGSGCDRRPTRRRIPRSLYVIDSLVALHWPGARRERASNRARTRLELGVEPSPNVPVAEADDGKRANAPVVKDRGVAPQHSRRSGTDGYTHSTMRSSHSR
jgi:hypothetical protein